MHNNNVVISAGETGGVGQCVCGGGSRVDGGGKELRVEGNLSDRKLCLVEIAVIN